MSRLQVNKAFTGGRSGRAAGGGFSERTAVLFGSIGSVSHHAEFNEVAKTGARKAATTSSILRSRKARENAT